MFRVWNCNNYSNVFRSAQHIKLWLELYLEFCNANYTNRSKGTRAARVTCPLDYRRANDNTPCTSIGTHCQYAAIRPKAETSTKRYGQPLRCYYEICNVSHWNEI